MNVDTQTSRSSESAGVDVRRVENDVGDVGHGAWVAEYDGTEAIGITRVEALKRLVKTVAREGHQ